MADVAWTEEATRQLDQIVEYIELFDPVAADQIGRRLRVLASSLAVSPHRGRPAGSGARELVTVRPYILRYRVSDDLVQIISVRHSRRRPLAD